MKNKSFITLLSVSLLAFSSCSDFLDTLPDSRTEINSTDKISPLLVSAYPTTYGRTHRKTLFVGFSQH